MKSRILPHNVDSFSISSLLFAICLLFQRFNQWFPNQNSFPLPHEVFELGLEQGTLLVYIYLVRQKSLKHNPTKLSCAIVSKAVGLCEKTVRRHLRTLVNQGLIQVADYGRCFSYSLCPIWDKVQERRSRDPLSEYEGGWSA